MPWFRVDDTLAWHAKTVQAGNAAMGLWVRAGSWSMYYLTDGFIPATIAQSLGSKTEINRLVTAGLWVTDVRDGQKGWSFHDWDDRQPAAETIIAERDKATERKRKQRQRGREQTTNGKDGRFERVRLTPVPTEGHTDVTA